MSNKQAEVRAALHEAVKGLIRCREQPLDFAASVAESLAPRITDVIFTVISTGNDVQNFEEVLSVLRGDASLLPRVEEKAAEDDD